MFKTKLVSHKFHTISHISKNVVQTTASFLGKFYGVFENNCIHFYQEFKK